MRGARATAVVIVVACAALGLTVAGAGASSGATRCAGSERAGHGAGLELRVTGLRATGVSCARGRAVIGDYLHLVITQRSERCASQVEALHGPGCPVDGYRCRAAGHVRLAHGLSIQAQACLDGPRALRFTEYQRSAG